ncbi:MAG: hypothetical protein U0R44_01110 [Candidatus Micrarchaeia archaeon]
MQKKLSGLERKRDDGPRIRLTEMDPQSGIPNILFVGTGVNLKTGKKISFKVPDTISKKGLEALATNVRMDNLYHTYLVNELQELD